MKENPLLEAFSEAGIKRQQQLATLRQLVLSELLGGLWHTTHPERFQSILASGAILPNPDIPDNARWKTSQGKDYHPYVRTIGGVSLFDFDDFDHEAYSRKCPMSSWYEFVPYRRVWGCSVWIEIDRAQLAAGFISGTDLVTRRNLEEAHQHTIMPYIEAAHLGPIPRAAFKKAFLVREGESQLQALSIGISAQ
jgi:hypothetical protein